MDFQVYFFIFLCGVFALTNSVKVNKKHLFILEASIFLFMSCFRDINYASDMHNYFSGFIRISKLSFVECFSFNWETGFVLLYKFISLFGQSKLYFTIITGIINTLPIMVFIYRNSENPFLSNIVYFTLFFNKLTGSAERQWIAVLIILCAYKYLEEKRPVPFFGIVLLASFFHRSALLFSFAYFASYFKSKKEKAFFAIISAVVCFVFRSQFFNIYIKLSRVPYSMEYNGGETLFIFFIVFFAVTLLLDRETYYNKGTEITLLSCAVAFQPLTFAFSQLARAINYFSFSLVFIIPVLMRLLKRSIGGDLVLDVGVAAVFGYLLHTVGYYPFVLI